MHGYVRVTVVGQVGQDNPALHDRTKSGMRAYKLQKGSLIVAEERGGDLGLWSCLSLEKLVYYRGFRRLEH